MFSSIVTPSKSPLRPSAAAIKRTRILPGPARSGRPPGRRHDRVHPQRQPRRTRKAPFLSLLGGSDVFGAAPKHVRRHLRSARSPRLHPQRAALPPAARRFHEMIVRQGVATTQGGARTKREFDSKVRLPDIRSFFKIENVEGRIVRNTENNEPEQIILISTTAVAKSEEIQKALHLYLLPPDPNQSANQPARGRSEFVRQSATGQRHRDSRRARTDEAPLLQNPGRAERAIFISRSITASPPLGGYPLGEDYDAVLKVPEPPREIEIQGRGGILALQGERKISIKSRGVGAIQFSSPASPPARSTTSSRKAKAASISRASSTTSTRKTSPVSPPKQQSIDSDEPLPGELFLLRFFESPATA